MWMPMGKLIEVLCNMDVGVIINCLDKGHET